MKIQFESDQAYQREAIRAVVDCFQGQSLQPDSITPVSQGDFELIGGLDTGSLSAVGNRLDLPLEILGKNLQEVQERNDLDGGPFHKWILNKISEEESMSTPQAFCPHYSVEMETGTGKTYVYLRTIFELNKHYGFKKFLIVVPSVAIREGVMNSLRITKDHFAELYNRVPCEFTVYDSKKITQLRQFASSNQIQILVINIQAFRSKTNNVIYQDKDAFHGQLPIDLIRATRPILIMDEPQSIDSTEGAQDSIKELFPLCTLRYSATHKNPYNLLYKLNPVQAFQLGLVKKIHVSSVTAEQGSGSAWIKVDEITYKPKLKAKIRIQVKNSKGEIKEASKTIKNGDDLYVLSGEFEAYRNGYVITEINGAPGEELIGFTNGIKLRLGQEKGGVQPDIWKVQIKRTIQKHLKKEIEVQGRGIKVLSLFFVDRVANYRQYDDLGQPKSGPFAVEFESILTELLKEEPYRSLYSGFTPENYGKLHGGYFASDKKGIVKDSNGNTQADDSAYELIMQDKEKLLSIDVPLRFIFSHSALREGWDNPNVFQICTLREMGSERDRRQTLGRGLRLPVDQSGRRIRDEVLNRLTVIANEDFESFASGLQTEYENECGIVFGKIEPRAFSRIEFVHQGESKFLGKDGSAQVRGELIHYGFLDFDGKILPKFDPKKEGFKLGLSKPFEGIEEEVIKVLCDHLPNKIVQKDQEPRKATLKLHKNRELDERFKGLWDRINTKTTYSVQYSSPELIKQCVKKIKAMPKIQATKILVSEAKVDVVQKGAVTELRNTQSIEIPYQGPLYDPVAFLQNEVELTRRTLKKIILESDRLIDYVTNPQSYLNEVLKIIRKELHELMLDGIQYRKIEGAESVWQMSLFENEELLDYFNSLPVEKSIYDAIPFDSDVEHKFAEALDKNDAIKLFVKLPRWFKIETPVGEYNPDWAIVKADEMTGKEKILYLVRETKGTKDFEKLRTTEAWKIHCGRQHFQSIGVDFDVAINAMEV